ncbi:MAG: toxin-activating lysine-acyltransferase [Magnetovibrio sp.]|nr:toxin-activating lysine-acyltransferase [Magnetovibrio sp.]
MSWLSHQDPLAVHWPISEFHQRIGGALECGQAKLFYEGQEPVGFVTWAWLDDECDARYRLAPTLLSSAQRQSGERLWLIDGLVLQAYSRSVAQRVINELFEEGTSVRWRSREHGGRVNLCVAGSGTELKLHNDWP